MQLIKHIHVHNFVLLTDCPGEQQGGGGGRGRGGGRGGGLMGFYSTKHKLWYKYLHAKCYF